MSNALAEVRQAGGLVAYDGRMAAQQVLQHAMVVQEVMQAVMKPEIHFGKIPGTDKPTLFQPGADKLLMAFRIAPVFDIEDLSTPDVVRYRVNCRGVHQVSGVELGSCVGEASSGEEKYKWRRAVNDKEFDATPITHRRVKFAKTYEVKQVRTEPADMANTVLKMAEKRAKIGMVLNVTGASDMFGQDLEDLDAALRDSLVGRDGTTEPPPPPAEPTTWPAEAFAAQFPRWKKAVEAGMKTAADIEALALSKGALSPQQLAEIRGLRAAPPAEAAPAPTAEPAPAPAAADDDFVSAMEAAERGADQA